MHYYRLVLNEALATLKIHDISNLTSKFHISDQISLDFKFHLKFRISFYNNIMNFVQQPMSKSQYRKIFDEAQFQAKNYRIWSASNLHRDFII